jgi:N-acetylmuramoyl-L-alanine amidase
MACFISAGHHLHDSGAIGSGTQENIETIKFRDVVVDLCKAKGLKVITDDDNETLSEYLKRIQSGDGSVVIEFHFDASDGKASGCTSIVSESANKNSLAFAKELSDATSQILVVNNRGVKDETETHRGRLGLMREHGTVALLEICFIDNKTDMDKFWNKSYILANSIADIICKYEKLID